MYRPHLTLSDPTLRYFTYLTLSSVSLKTDDILFGFESGVVLVRLVRIDKSCEVQLDIRLVGLIRTQRNL